MGAMKDDRAAEEASRTFDVKVAEEGESFLAALAVRGSRFDVCRSPPFTAVRGSRFAVRRRRRSVRRSVGSVGQCAETAPVGGAGASMRARSVPSAMAAFVRSAPPMGTPRTKTWGNVGQPLHILIARRRCHSER